MTPAEYAALNGYQQQQQEENGNLLDFLGKAALVAGVAFGGYKGIQYLRGRGAQKAATLQDVAETAKVAAPTVEKSVERLGEINQYTRQARAERPAGIVQGKLPTVSELVEAEEEEYRAFRPDVRENLSPAVQEARRQQATANLLARVQQMREPYQLSLPGINPTLMAIRGVSQEVAEVAPSVVYQPGPRVSLAAAPKQIGLPFETLTAKADEALESIRGEGTTSAAAAQGDFALQYLKNAGYQDDVTMVDQHTGNLVAQIDHFANASNSAEDQVTGRVKAALSRNEDVNLGAVEIAEDQVDAQIARAAQGDPTIASVTEVDAAINQVADNLPDGRPVDQAELDLAKITEYQQSRQAQIQNAMARGLSRARAERNVQMTPSQRAAMERVLPSYSPEDVMSLPGLQVVESEGAPGVLRQEPVISPLGAMVSPASKTSYRGITGRPDFGIYGDVPSGKRGYVEFGPGSVAVNKLIINEGEERAVTTPSRFEPGYNLAKQETPEGFVYTEEALQRPTAGTSKTGLENVDDEVVGMMTMAGDPMQRESARAEFARRDPEYLQQRVEAGKAGETVRRIMSSGQPDAQKLVSQYLTQLRQQQG